MINTMASFYLLSIVAFTYPAQLVAGSILPWVAF